MAFSLLRLPTGKWGMTVVAQGGATLECNGLPGAIIKQRWATDRQAMQAVDAAMERVVARLAATGIVARQRAFVPQGHETGRQRGGRASFVEVDRA
jgi:hypothetical protein